MPADFCTEGGKPNSTIKEDSAEAKKPDGEEHPRHKLPFTDAVTAYGIRVDPNGNALMDNEEACTESSFTVSVVKVSGGTATA